MLTGIEFAPAEYTFTVIEFAPNQHIVQEVQAPVATWTRTITLAEREGATKVTLRMESVSVPFWYPLVWSLVKNFTGIKGALKRLKKRVELSKEQAYS